MADSSINETPTAIIDRAIADGQFLRCTLSKRRTKTDVEFTRVSARPITLREGTAIQLAYQHPHKETHENLSDAAAADRLAHLLDTTFEHGHLFTTTADYEIRALSEGAFRIKRRAASKQAVDTSHNRAKQYLIPEGVPCPFLFEIGVMNRRGKVLAAKRKKFRQINRFLEIVNDIVPNLPKAGCLRVVDFGCGKSYLTFALHHLLTVIHDREVKIRGVDRENSVVSSCVEIANRLGCRGLSFETGDIRTFDMDEKVDLAVSLHACDTATDDAIAKAVQWNAEVILAVPCCQHEIAKSMNYAGLTAITEQGILKERFAAIATDALRASALQVHGYATQVTEFIDMEHTPKNLLIRAVKQPFSEQRMLHSMSAYYQLKEELSLEAPYLERVLPLDPV